MNYGTKETKETRSCETARTEEGRAAESGAEVGIMARFKDVKKLKYSTWSKLPRLERKDMLKIQTVLNKKSSKKALKKYGQPIPEFD